jgi:hypothetical protein
MKGMVLLVISVVIIVLAAVAMGWIPPRGPALRAAEDMEAFADRMEAIQSREELKPVTQEVRRLFERGYAAWVEYRNLPADKQKVISPELHERVRNARIRFKEQEGRFYELKSP